MRCHFATHDASGCSIEIMLRMQMSCCNKLGGCRGCIPFEIVGRSRINPISSNAITVTVRPRMWAIFTKVLLELHAFGTFSINIRLSSGNM
jgi:hypothetical protein